MFRRLQRMTAVLVMALFLWTDAAVVYGAGEAEPVKMTVGEASDTASVNEKVRVSAPSALLMEASTGQVIYEKNANERRSPASVTKVMTMLLAMESLAIGEVSLQDEVVTSEHASSMGGSQVFLEAGEVQTFEVLLKCVAVASGNDASVAIAEHISGTEDAFVALMNKRAKQLGMEDTHFMDCCGLSDSDEHYTTAKDIAIMSRELVIKYPEILEYTQIWMEDITHVTRKGSSVFTLSSTNKLLKWYPYTTGLKTGSTSKAKYCISATASKEDLQMIAVIMGAEDPKQRFLDAQTLLAYGFGVSDIYIDKNKEDLPPYQVEGGVSDTVSLQYEGEFRYLDVTGKHLENIEKVIRISDAELIPNSDESTDHALQAPIAEGQIVGEAVYTLDGAVIGKVNILAAEAVLEAKYPDYLQRAFHYFLLGESVVE